MFGSLTNMDQCLVLYSFHLRVYLHNIVWTPFDTCKGKAPLRKPIHATKLKARVIENIDQMSRQEETDMLIMLSTLSIIPPAKIFH